MGRWPGKLASVAVKGSFWKGKRVLITGNTGFKGAWLSLWLHRLGAEVFGYSLSVPTEPSLFQLCKLPEIASTTFADIRDLAQLIEVLDRVKPEIVFHMAAQSLVRRSYVEPIETYSTNVMGTVHLLDAVRRVGGVKALIVVTSDKCYESSAEVWGHRETDRLGGFDPYSNSKACCELITDAYRNSFFSSKEHCTHGTGIASVRAGNVVGGGDWAEDRLIPDMIGAFLLKQPVIIRHPDAVRPWQHVLDPLRGYLAVAERLFNREIAFAEPWNFGPSVDDAKPVRWIVERLVTLWGAGAGWSIDDGMNPHEASYLRLDCSKARFTLQWSPTWNLETTLDKIVDWYRSYERGDDMRAKTLEQIAEYESATGE
jgi:CDP-glucose 4,6-dehydratase